MPPSISWSAQDHSSLERALRLYSYQSELATALGVTESRLSRWLKRSHYPRDICTIVELRRRIAKVLGCPKKVALEKPRVSR